MSEASHSDPRRAAMGIMLLFEETRDSIDIKIERLYPEGTSIEGMLPDRLRLAGKHLRIIGPNGGCRVCPGGHIVCGPVPCDPLSEVSEERVRYLIREELAAHRASLHGG